MILKTLHKGQQSRFFRPFLVLSSLLLLLVLGLFLVSYIRILPVESGPSAEIISCDMENVSLLDGKEVLISNDRVFQGLETRSSEKSRSGQYASKVGGEQRYGLGYFFREAKAGEQYKASVWRYGPKLTFSYLTVSIVGGEDQSLYKQEEKAVEVDENEWEKLELVFEIPDWYGGQEVKIYAYTATGEGTYIYFDDFQLERLQLNEGRRTALLADTVFQTLKLRIPEEGMKKIEAKREEAIHRGILFSAEDDWVKAGIGDEPMIPVKLRLKGDWMDHLKTDKWSFRISVKAPHAWNRLITFSIQHPKTRFFLTEWVYHQFLTREDVLSPRYDFLHVTLNGEAKGVYAFEEHFEKQLPEFRERREGPIVKFSEDGVWNARKRGLDIRRITNRVEEKLNSFESSNIETFKEGKTLASPLLKEQYAQARTLMDQYRFGEKTAAEIFDLDKLATYYAITDITRGYHSMFWHNQRFYFNPVISKLEPVGYDAFTEGGKFEYSTLPFLGAQVTQLKDDPSADIMFRPFQDSAFMVRYIQALDRMSEKTYVEQLLLELKPAIEAREALLKSDFPNYAYTDRIADQARDIRSLLFPLNDNSLRAYAQKVSASHTELKLTNFHVLPLEVVGFGRTSDRMSTQIAPEWLIPHNPNHPPVYHSLEAPANVAFVFFRLPGLDKLYHSRIAPWTISEPQIPAQEAYQDAKPVSNDWYEVEGNIVRFLPGEHRINRNLIFPKGYSIQMTGGTSLDLINGAKFLSWSPVEMLGGEDAPVRIYSSDKTARGFTVLQANERSRLHYVVFENFNTLMDRGWTLTGAVNFYESNVRIENCSFLNAQCEDALNIIRSNFELNNSLINGGPSDGFDADFCKGIIRNCRFENMGNDGVDVSGSVISIYDCSVDGVGDKGVSVGEASKMVIHSIDIAHANNGVVCKDLSETTVHNVSLTDCRTGFAAYQKKPEYGGASFTVHNYSATNVKFLHLIERGSTLNLKDQMIEGI